MLLLLFCKILSSIRTPLSHPMFGGGPRGGSDPLYFGKMQFDEFRILKIVVTRVAGFCLHIHQTGVCL